MLLFCPNRIETATTAIQVRVPRFLKGPEKEYNHNTSWNRDYPRIQILTIEELLRGKKVDMPPEHGTFK